MTRPGRPSDARVNQIKQTILGLLTKEGRTFSQITKAARTQGISKPCVWRHLERFAKMGIVTHRSRLYYINPLYDKSVAVGMLSLRHLSEHGHQKYTHTDTFPVNFQFKELYGRIAKGHPRNWADPLPSGSFDLTKQDELRTTFFLGVIMALVHYLSILEGVTKIDDSKAAEEFVDLMMTAEVIPPLRGFARWTWLGRRQISLKDLDGLKLPLVVRHARPNAAAPTKKNPG